MKMRTYFDGVDDYQDSESEDSSDDSKDDDDDNRHLVPLVQKLPYDLLE